MSIERPEDAWERIRKARRLSDTVECRRAFADGLTHAVNAIANDLTRDHNEVALDLLQATARFVRERC